MTSELDRGISRRLGQFVSGCSVLAIAFGLWVLTGWTLHIQIMERLLPGQVAVKANTAICFILIGVALWILRKEQPPGVASWRLAAKIAARPDQRGGTALLVRVPMGLGPGHRPTALFRGTVRHCGKRPPRPDVAHHGLWLLCAWACPAAAGRQNEIWPLVGTVVVRWRGRGFPVWHPGFCSGSHVYPYSHLSHYRLPPCFCSRSGCCSPRTQSGLGALVTSATLGGTLTRRLLPAAILVPLVVAWLRWKGQSSGLYSDWAGVALMTVFTVMLLASLTVWTGWWRNAPTGRAAKGRKPATVWRLSLPLPTTLSSPPHSTE